MIIIWDHLESGISQPHGLSMSGGVGETHRRPVSQVPRSPSGGAGLQSHGSLGGDAEGDPARCGDDQQEVAMGQVWSWKWRCLVDFGTHLNVEKSVESTLNYSSKFKMIPDMHVCNMNPSLTPSLVVFWVFRTA